MAACPVGHESSTTDYCDVCGTLMTAAPPPAAEPAAAGPAAQEPPGKTATQQYCAVCGEPRSGRFCEACGHDAEMPVPDVAPAAPSVPPSVPPSAPTPGWTAVVRADRAWFEEVRRRDGPDVATVEFPPYAPERRFTLSGPQIAIGRRSRSRGIDPEIDLTGPPLDPGVSALHALLLPGTDGGWTIVDMDSRNGTTVGDGPDPIPPRTPVPLPDGTVVRIGAWTVLTVHAP